MKRVEKRRLNPNLVRLIVLGVMLVLLIGAYFVVRSVSKNQTQGGGTAADLPDIREELGESSYVNVPIAYPRIEERYMDYLLVFNRDDEGRLRTFDLTALSDGSFILSYSLDGTTKEMIPYIPTIVGAEGDFDYTSLYAIESNDSYGRIYLLTYLCTAVGTPYFSERIDLPTDSAERDEMLLRFGLDEASASGVAFTYKNADGTKGSHKVSIGKRALSGSGFYYMVDDRNVVYYTTSNYFEYALRGFADFVNGRLVAKGLDSDYNFEPYLTTDYKQWVNTEHKTEGERVTAGSTVIVSGSAALPIAAGSEYTPDSQGGYYVDDGTFTFSSDDLRDHTDFRRFEKHLTELAVGKYDTPVRLTLLDELGSSSSSLITFGDGDELKYTYKITAVESVITDTREITDPAALAGVDYSLVKLTYDLYIDGVKKNEIPLHGVIDLAGGVITDADADAIRAVGIGNADVTLDVTYTPDNSLKATETLYVSAITGIFSQEGELLEKVAADSFVSFVYYEIVNGYRTSSRSITLDLSAQDESERWSELRDKIVGKKIGNELGLKLYERTYSYEVMRDFTEYRVDEVVEFITGELVVSFRYVNKPEQDPFYGESVYENTMDEHKGYEQYAIYGVDATACQNVLATLGGVGSDGTTTSAGYSGVTVALGLTHDVMREYHLYDNTIYLELPRGIYDPSDYDTEIDSSEDMGGLASYAWYDTLGFTLYVSDEIDGYRYVGSDMYDLVARVPASDFSFLDHSFSELWARNSFLFMDVTNIKEIDFDFNMTDYYGSYDFTVSRETWYVGSNELGGFANPKPFEGGTPTTRLYVDIASAPGSMPTEYERIKTEKGLETLSVSKLYSELHNGGKDYYAPSSLDTVGVVNYKGLFEKLFLTAYQDRILTEAEKAAALARPSLMTMSVKVYENDGSIRPGYYTYDFYYVDGSRVMVSAYRTDNSGNVITARVSDFTISNYAFENIVLSVFGILNGETLDDNSGYIDKK